MWYTDFLETPNLVRGGGGPGLSEIDCTQSLLNVIHVVDWPTASMIPAFNEHGYLPAGIHTATLDEVEARFGRESEVRRVQMESLRWLVNLTGRAGVKRLVINGSFVTDVLEPNDVDCVLLIGPGFPDDHAAEAELLAGLPFLELSLVSQTDFDLLVEMFFATDRHSVNKGMVEIRP